jgi:hypothetical protein
MAGQPLATAYVRVRPQVDRRGFQRETEQGARGIRLDKAGREAGRSFFAGFAKIATVGLGALGAFGVLKGFVSDAEDAAKVNQLLASTIRSTGDASKTTVGHLEDYANVLMAQTGVNDEAIKSGEAMLLTFTNIRNEAGKGNNVFDQTTKAVLDMTAAMSGGDVSQENMRKTSILVGKALNDPIKGLTALRRVGVAFTDQQTRQITAMVKSGDTLGAQKLILRELTKEFGGAAAATKTPSERLATAFREIGENIGTALLPLIDRLAAFIVKSVLPALNRFTAWFTKDAIPAIEGFAQRAIPLVITGFKLIGGAIGFIARNREWIIPLAGAFAAFAGAIMLIVKAVKIWREAQILLNIALTANPIGLVIAAIAALAAGIYLAWTRSATFRKIVEAAWHGILVAVQAVSDWFVRSFVPFFTTTIPKVFFTAWHAIYDNFVHPLIIFFTQTIPGVITGFIRWIRIQFDRFELFWVQLFAGMVHALAVSLGWIPFGVGDSLRKADKAAAGWVRSIQERLDSLHGKIIPVTVRVLGTGGISAATSGGLAIQGATGKLLIRGLARGGRITAGTGPAADDVLLRASKGETVVSAAHSRMLAPLFSAMRIPGFAAGGLVGAPDWAAARGAAFSSAVGTRFAQAIAGAFRRAAAAVPGVGGNVTSWVLAAMAATMAPASWLPALLTLVRRESGGNPRAWNPVSVFGEHASGLMQMLPSTFAQFATVPGGIWNPVANAVAALRYIMARYGSPFNIPNLFAGPYIGYDRGGWLPPGLSMAWNGTGRPEPVGMGGEYHFHFHGPVASREGAKDMVLAAVRDLQRERRLP